ncbi:hypothetical protein QTP88_028590 [Uroleucon formosanum]
MGRFYKAIMGLGIIICKISISQSQKPLIGFNIILSVLRDVRTEGVEVVEILVDDEYEAIEVQVGGEENMEVIEVHMGGGDGVEVVEVMVDYHDEGVEVVDVPIDEARAELEFANVLDYGPIAVGFPAEQPRERAPVIDRPAGVTHPLLERHHVGALTAVCRHCDARHFSSERMAMGHFSTCCNNGQVTATGDRVSALYLLMNLLISDSQDSRRYRTDIRRYNNALAFAAFTSSVNPRRLPGRGPRVFTLQVQVYHRTNNDVAVNREEARYCELYFLESGEANARRLDMAQQRNRHELSKSVITDLDNMLRKRNPYALAFRNMRQAWQAERDLADADPAGVRPRPTTMHFVTDATRDQRPYNLPTTNEVAAVFVGDDGRPPRNLDLVIYDTNPIDAQHRMQNILAG